MVIITALHREKTRIFFGKAREVQKESLAFSALSATRKVSQTAAAAFAFVPNFHTNDETLVFHEKKMTNTVTKL